MAYYITNDGMQVHVAGMGLNPDEIEGYRCGCGRNGNEGFTRSLTLTFTREELLYDIKQIAYVEGDVVGGQSDHSLHQLMDVGEDGNIDRVTRLLDLAYAEVREVLYAHTKVAVEDGTRLDDVLTETDEYVIHMLVPDDFSETTALLMERYIHEYMIYRVLAEWMELTNKVDAAAFQSYALKADAAMEKVKDSLSQRINRTRRKKHPW